MAGHAVRAQSRITRALSFGEVPANPSRLSSSRTCSTPADNKPSHVYLGGNGTIEITGIDPSQYTYPANEALYEGISFFQARPTDHGGVYGNTNEATFIGTNAMSLDGTLYFPAGRVNVSGTSDNLGTQLIADTVLVSGNGEVVINYDGRNQAPGNKVFLVY